MNNYTNESVKLIEFDFFPPNHSVVRAEYKFPCIPYEDTGTDKVGFFSGFHPVDVLLSNVSSKRRNDKQLLYSLSINLSKHRDLEFLTAYEANAEYIYDLLRRISECFP